ncbi:MAG: hypothetical protein R3F53_05515 [Gammaproteobacteria bacterium]
MQVLLRGGPGLLYRDGNATGAYCRVRNRPGLCRRAGCADAVTDAGQRYYQPPAVQAGFPDRIGGLQTLLLGSSLQCLVLAAFLTADTLTALYVLAIAFGLSQGGRAFLCHHSADVFPAREAGWRIGTALFFTMIRWLWSGWMAGALYDLTGSYQAAFINAIGFNIMNMIIAAWLLQRFRKVHTTRPVLQG